MRENLICTLRSLIEYRLDDAAGAAVHRAMAGLIEEMKASMLCEAHFEVSDEDGSLDLVRSAIRFVESQHWSPGETRARLAVDYGDYLTTRELVISAG